jgi:hypothetical protein
MYLKTKKMIPKTFYLNSQVLFFLFGILDKDKRTTDFRDCYPILDKKAESQFRQKAYAWYTGMTGILWFRNMIFCNNYIQNWVCEIFAES